MGNRYWTPDPDKELTPEDVRQLLKGAKTDSLVDALEWLEAAWPEYGTVHLSDGQLFSASRSEIITELETRPHLNLAVVHTRELLKWLQATRSFGGWCYPAGNYGNYAVSEAELRKELAGRPHIPNKREARAKRQAAALNARKGKQRSSHR